MSGWREEQKLGGDRSLLCFQSRELTRLEATVACSFVSLVFQHLPYLYLTLDFYYWNQLEFALHVCMHVFATDGKTWQCLLLELTVHTCGPGKWEMCFILWQQITEAWELAKPYEVPERAPVLLIYVRMNSHSPYEAGDVSLTFLNFLGRKMNGLGALVMFSSLLPAAWRRR